MAWSRTGRWDPAFVGDGSPETGWIPEACPTEGSWCWPSRSERRFAPRPTGPVARRPGRAERAGTMNRSSRCRSLQSENLTSGETFAGRDRAPALLGLLEIGGDSDLARFALALGRKQDLAGGRIDQPEIDDHFGTDPLARDAKTFDQVGDASADTRFGEGEPSDVAGDQGPSAEERALLRR